jgi:hypothetical protein
VAKIKLYHGTTIENYKSILENGFSGNRDIVWTYASDSDYTYFWNPKELKKSEDLENMDEAINYAKDRAAESAKIAGAIFKSKSDKIIVLEIEVDSKFVTPDDSCQNMEGAVKVFNDDLKVSDIKNTYYCDFLPTMSLIYLVGLMNNQNIELGEFLTSFELSILESMKEQILPEEIWYNEFD